MAEREELYLKHIDENTGRIAKALEYIVEREKEIKAEQDQWAKEKEERAKREEENAKQREACRSFFYARDIVITTLFKNGMSDDELDKLDDLTEPYWPKGVEQ